MPPRAIASRSKRMMLRETSSSARNASSIGAAEESLALQIEKAGHRPAASPGHKLHRGHIHGVYVGPAFAIDFDGDEMLV